MRVLFFTASWCSACKGSRPTVIKACKDAGADYMEVNLDEDDSLGIKYQVCGLPTVIIEKNNEEFARREGAITRQDLISLIRGAD